MAVVFSSKGDFKRITSFIQRVKENFHIGLLNKYGKRGVEALAAATPKDTGLTAASWYYTITRKKDEVRLEFHNSNIQPGYYEGEYGVPIAIIIQYGHGTKDGHWVEGVDYINPVLQPLFREIAEKAWKEVKQTV